MLGTSKDNQSLRAALGLLRGADRFMRQVHPQNAELFKGLASSQSPHTLFLACCDSRIVPELITQTQPGELFVSRNIGNIVPAYGEMLGGVSAVIEYAVMVIGVQQIVICGHSDCGAMKGLLGAPLTHMPTVSSWLRNAEAARSVVLTRELPPDQALRAMIEQNVRLQLAHLRTHPSVSASLAKGTLTLHGWVYDIEHGNVSIVVDGVTELVSVSDAITWLESEIGT